ncbi:hypothetical protein SAMN05216420_10672 [Nitrosospira sp. Nl5]|nr:hypothetical protein SAMN05216420_10672 [Nitrosospira sp. Nl5]
MPGSNGMRELEAAIRPAVPGRFLATGTGFYSAKNSRTLSIQDLARGL